MRAVTLRREQTAQGPLILVNPSHPLRAGHLPELTAPDLRRPEVLLERQTARLLAACVQAAGGAGDIVPVSGWRSQREQEAIWRDTWAKEGEAFTRRYVALPGCSEHQTGLAIDLGKRAEHIDFIRPDFPKEGACGVFRRLAAEYGFTDGQKELLEELLRPEHLELFQALIGSSQDLTLSIEQVQEILDRLPEGLSEERRQVILTAYQLLGKVNYFWGGKSHVLGWDSRWGTPKEVWAAGSPSTGTVRPYGLDCSGFVDGVFYNVSGGTYIIGHGGGAHMQHTYCDPISWDEAIPGDLVFYPEDTHVGIVCGFDSGALISRRLDRVSMAARTRSAPAAASPPPSENARGSGRSRTWRLKAASRRTAACALNSPTSASV